MKPNLILVLSAVAVGVIAGAVHISVSRRLDEIHSRNESAAGQLKSEQQQLEEMTKRLEEARRQPRPSPRPVSSKKTGPTAKKGSQQANSGAASNRAKAILLAKNPELRRMSVQAYVDQRRLDFAGLFKTLGFTSAQLQRFDQIQTDYQEGLLEAAASAAEQNLGPNDPSVKNARFQLAQAQQAQYEELFGSTLPLWTEANETLGARRVVDQIVEENFQGQGSFTAESADQLTQILASNRTGRTSSDATGYKWDAVLEQARAVLTPVQMEGLDTSLMFYQAEAQMAAIAAR